MQNKLCAHNWGSGRNQNKGCVDLASGWKWQIVSTERCKAAWGEESAWGGGKPGCPSSLREVRKALGLQAVVCKTWTRQPAVHWRRKEGQRLCPGTLLEGWARCLRPCIKSGSEAQCVDCYLAVIVDSFVVLLKTHHVSLFDQRHLIHRMPAFEGVAM